MFHRLAGVVQRMKIDDGTVGAIAER